MTRLSWLVGAVGVGTIMQLAAHLAADPGRDWIQWVVNWGALWVVLPFLAGRRSDAATSACFLGSLLGAVEVAAYYGVSGSVGVEPFWIVTGAVACGAVGLGGRASACHRRGMLALPLLLILEPIAMTAVFLLLGRGLGEHWFRSAAAELAVGMAAAGLVVLNAD